MPTVATTTENLRVAAYEPPCMVTGGALEDALMGGVWLTSKTTLKDLEDNAARYGQASSPDYVFGKLSRSELHTVSSGGWMGDGTAPALEAKAKAAPVPPTARPVHSMTQRTSQPS